MFGLSDNPNKYHIMKFERLPFKQSVFRYLAIVGVFMVAMVVLKVVEYFALGIAAQNGRQVWMNALAYNLIVASWMALGIGVLYYLIRLFSEKMAVAAGVPDLLPRQSRIRSTSPAAAFPGGCC